LLFVVIFTWALRLQNTQEHAQGSSPLPFTSFYLTSDQISQQTILHDWENGLGERAITGDDSFIVKWPIYYLTNNLPVSPVARQFLTSLLILSITAAGLMAILILFVHRIFKDKKHRLFGTLAIAGLLIAVPAVTFEYMAWPNSRNIELVMYLGLIYSLYISDFNLEWFRHRTLLKVSGIVGVAALLFVDDPLFMYLSVPLLIGLIAFRYTMGVDNIGEKTILLSVVAALSFLGMYALRGILTFITPLAIYTHRPAAFDSILFVNNIKNFFIDGLKIVGVNFDVSTLSKTGLVFSALSLALFICAVIGIIAQIRKHPRSIFYQFLLLSVLWNAVLIGFMGDRITGDFASSRYNIAIYVIELIGIILLIKSIRLKRQYVLLATGLSLMVVLSCLFIYQAHKISDTERYSLNRQNQDQIINAIDQLGLKKGYSNNNYGNIMTFLSDYKTTYLPSVCMINADGTAKLKYFDILTEIGVKNKLSVDRSFYMYVESDNKCTGENLIPQLGSPIDTKTLTLKNGVVANIFIYNYDISKNIPVQAIE